MRGTADCREAAGLRGGQRCVEALPGVVKPVNPGGPPDGRRTCGAGSQLSVVGPVWQGWRARLSGRAPDMGGSR